MFPVYMRNKLRTEHVSELSSERHYKYLCCLACLLVDSTSKETKGERDRQQEPGKQETTQL